MNVEAGGSHYLQGIIACGCTISFPRVSFDNSFSLLHLAINRIYITGTHVEWFYVESLIVEHGRIDNMADDKMKHDDQRNMGAGGQDKGVGQQSPGRGQQGGQQGGQQAGQHGQQGGQKGSQGMEDDDEFATGSQKQSGGQNRGGQNR
jgi:hypothetical protein